jgi:hypothetical protein
MRCGSKRWCGAGLLVPVIGVGAWSWGDRSGYWGYGKEYGKEESRAAYKVSMPPPTGHLSSSTTALPDQLQNT